MREWVCLNGQLMPAEQAAVSVFDSGFMQGVGLFETMRAYNGVVFRLEQHIARLLDSARKLGWTALPTERVLRDNVEQAVGAMEADATRVRLTVTTGTLRAAAPTDPELTIVASASPGGEYPREAYERGVTVVVSDYRQSVTDPTCGHKTTSYFARLASLRKAHTAGAFEALWFTDAHVLAEGAISNVFLVDDGVLLTPPLETPVLPGITRAAVLEVARENKIPIREEESSLQDVLNADEIFLTNSVMEIVPVVRVEREAIGLERPGEITARLCEGYCDLVEKETRYG